MKERPILFSGPMVRGILDGRKTQTRRLVKHIPALGAPEDWCEFAISQPDDFTRLIGDYRRYCKYGVPDDLLWVREAWAQISGLGLPEDLIVYRECDPRTTYGGPWKPSIHMRYRDSRIALQIDSVRVERLHDISESDAIAEGIERAEYTSYWYDYVNSKGYETVGLLDPKKSYQSLWESINGFESWDANPYVWVIGFHRVNQEAGNV